MRWAIPWVVVLAALAGCGADDDRGGDSEKPPRTVIDVGGEFGDIAFVCHGTTGVYVGQDDTYASSSVAAIANDPHCVEE